VDVPRPTRTVNPTAKLKDAANTEEPQLSFQRKAVQEFRSRQADLNDAPPSSTVGADPQVLSADTGPVGLTLQNKRRILSVDGSDSDNGIIYPVPCTSSSMLMKATFSFAAYFIAKKKRTVTTTSQAKRATSITIDTVDDVDMMDAEDAEEDIHPKGTIFPITTVHQHFTTLF
jgi:hypothetical protein